jgi:N-acetyl sugar amidotransferase
MAQNYQICTRCVMDTSDPDITFDSAGVCNHCHHFDALSPRYRVTPQESKLRLATKAAQIKADRKGRYDSILGLSGGIDSSYAAYLAGQLGLNPLIVHFDNGWNSEVAVANIEKIINKLGFDLSTYVIEWDEFRDIQRSYFRASVIDIEVVSDHAISASMFKIARENDIKYVLSGTNFNTEHTMPHSWIYRKQDLTNLRDIQRRYGTLPIRSFPTLPTWRFQAAHKLGWGQSYVELLNDIEYSRSGAIKTLADAFGWVDYGGKHYESVFTKFYQAYVLIKKFKVDKRRPHYTDMIHNAEMTRADALARLEAQPYSAAELSQDRDYVLKKLGFSENEFEAMMREPPKSHESYKTDQWQVDLMKKARNLFLGGKKL